MAQHYIFTKQRRLRNLSYDDRFDDIFSDWQHKAERLQLRRWRKIKHQLV